MWFYHLNLLIFFFKAQPILVKAIKSPHYINLLSTELYFLMANEIVITQDELAFILFLKARLSSKH